MKKMYSNVKNSKNTPKAQNFYCSVGTSYPMRTVLCGHIKCLCCVNQRHLGKAFKAPVEHLLVSPLIPSAQAGLI